MSDPIIAEIRQLLEEVVCSELRALSMKVEHLHEQIMLTERSIGSQLAAFREERAAFRAEMAAFRLEMATLKAEMISLPPGKRHLSGGDLLRESLADRRPQFHTRSSPDESLPS